MEVSPEVTIVKQYGKMLLALPLKSISKFEEKNVNKHPQPEVQKKENLDSSEQFANQGNTTSRGHKGEAAIYRENSCPGS